MLLKGEVISEMEYDTIKAYGWNGSEGPSILCITTLCTYMTGQFHILTALYAEYIFSVPTRKEGERAP